MENEKKQEDKPKRRELTEAEAEAVSGGTGPNVAGGKLKSRTTRYIWTPPVLVPIVVE